jgi:ACT domain-containing protein
METHIKIHSRPQVKPSRHPENNSATRFTIVAFLTVSSALALPSCSAASTNSGAVGGSAAPLAGASQSVAAPSLVGSPPQGAADQNIASAVKQAKADESTSAKAETPATPPQLIKKATLSLVVKSIDESTKSVTDIVKKRQGDILGFQSEKPPDSSIRQTATLEIRVPQEQLETTLNALVKLGNVQNRAMSAEDVTAQLVDSEARLRNLRKSEEMVLKIMERSGSISDVLKAAKELSNIRESIERIDAQLKSLRNQVAYSTINLTLESAVSAEQTVEPSLGLRMQEAWGQATHSVSELTLSLLSLMIWMLAYSPYFLIIGVAGFYGFNRLKKKQSVLSTQEPKPPQ